MYGERTKDQGRALHRLLSAVLVGVACLLVAGLAGAAPGDAEAARGIVYAWQHNCAKAVPLLEAAERLRHRPSTEVPLAECYLAGSDLLRASDVLHQAAAQKPAFGWQRPDFNAVGTAKKMAAQVDARIPTLRFQASESYPGLVVEVDGARVDNLGAERRLLPGIAVNVAARAPGRRSFADKVVLGEGERRVLVLRLDPAGGLAVPSSPSAEVAPPEPARGPLAPARPPPTRWLGLRYYGVVLPKFVMNLFADGGRTLLVPGGAFTFNTKAAGVELTFALGYLSYAMGGTPFKPDGDPVTQWELDSSTLSGFTATVDVMWAIPLDPAGHVAFRIGGAAGGGWMALGNLYREQIYPPNGMPGNPSTYLKCLGPNDPRGTYAYCNGLAHDHYPGYTEPDWFHGGIRPSVFPWLVLPQVGFTFHPSRATAIDVETGASISGFLTSVGFRVGL
jgi:hypothetical protein